MTDYHTVIAQAVESLDQNTSRTRRVLYERARTAKVISVYQSERLEQLARIESSPFLTLPQCLFSRPRLSVESSNRAVLESPSSLACRGFHGCEKGKTHRNGRGRVPLRIWRDFITAIPRACGLEASSPKALAWIGFV
jgi:hypothetical protein